MTRWGTASAAAALVAATLVALTTAPGALAREATGAEVRKLASSAAAGDGRALAALRDVDRVDGRRFQLGKSLGVAGDRLRSRLRSLAAEPAASTPDAATARRRASQLLAEDRFHEPSFPRPLRGLFQSIATVIQPVIDGVEDLIDEIASAVPGGRPAGFTLLAVAVLLGFAALSSRTLRLRSRRRATAAVSEAARSRGPSPAELERAADDAERAGDLSLAVRLLFRAGLLRLDERGAIRLQPSLTTAAIARRLGSSEFTEIAAAFEEVAYGGRAAGHSDVEAQRSGWRRVLGAVRR